MRIQSFKGYLPPPPLKKKKDKQAKNSNAYIYADFIQLNSQTIQPMHGMQIRIQAYLRTHGIHKHSLLF